MEHKLGIVGAGHVGANVAYTACMRGTASEIKLVDIDEEKANSQYLDITDAMSFYARDTKVTVSKHEDLGDCDVIVICCSDGLMMYDRLAELDVNHERVKDFVPKIMNAGFKGIFIVVTNPCDVVAYDVLQESGLPKNRVISSGTALDSARLKAVLANKLGISPKSISGYMMGEHGDSQFVPWSKIQIFGKPIEDYLKENPEIEKNFDRDSVQEEVRKRGWYIAVKKQCTEYGIAHTVNNLIQSIFNDERRVHMASGYLDGEYGQKDIFLSSPCIIGKNGIEKIIEVELKESEWESFRKTAGIIESYTGKIRK